MATQYLTNTPTNRAKVLTAIAAGNVLVQWLINANLALTFGPPFSGSGTYGVTIFYNANAISQNLITSGYTLNGPLGLAGTISAVLPSTVATTYEGMDVDSYALQFWVGQGT